MEIVDTEVFNSWILPIVKPICLADPESLARYIVVLLKKSNPKPDLRSYCVQNLGIFIDAQKIKIEDFVDMVVEAVEKKTYMGEEWKSKNRKHRRSSPRRRSSRSPRRRRSQERRRSRRSRSRSPARQREKEKEREREKEKDEEPKRQQVCPMFEKQGYCLEGESCTYTHPGFLQVEEKDIKAIADSYQVAAGPEQPKVEQQLNKNAHISPVMAQYLQFGFQQIQQAAAASTSGEQQPIPVAMQQPDQQQPFPQMESAVPVVMHNNRYNNNRMMRQNNNYNPHQNNRRFNHHHHQNNNMNLSTQQLDNEMDEIAQANQAARNGQDPGMQQQFQPEYGRGRGRWQRGRGYRGQGGRGGGQSRQAMHNGSTALEIRKIPANLNSIGSLNQHFQSFGPVSNIQVHFDQDPEAALVTFQNHQDALAAYRSAEPLFNNRFIRVFWHKPQQQDSGEAQQQQPGDPQQQQQQQQPNPAEEEKQQQQQQKDERPKPPPRAKMRIDHISEAKAKVTDAQEDVMKRRRLLLANYLEMRKSLQEKLSNASDQERSGVESTLKTVDEKIAQMKLELFPHLQQQQQNRQRQAGNKPAGEQQPGAEGQQQPADEQQQKPSRANFIVDRRPKQLLISRASGLTAQSIKSHFGLFCHVDGVEQSSEGFLLSCQSRKDAEIAKARGLVFHGQQLEISWHQPSFYQVTPQQKQPADGESEPQQQEQQGEEQQQQTEERGLFEDDDDEQPPQPQPEQQMQPESAETV